VLEINIPAVNKDNFSKYDLVLAVDESWGEPAYISPRPYQTKKNDGKNMFFYQKEQLDKVGISGAFGNFQIFNFEITYHIENSLPKNARSEIALPPDTFYQRIYYKSIEPKPEYIRIDEDGNWLAAYNVEPNQRLDINASGSVQIFMTPQDFYPKQDPVKLSDYLKNQKFWETSDPLILNLASELNTPKKIYDFVVSKLDYDYSRVKESPKRLGAKGSLKNPSSAVCTEFTDLFIALSRAAGIPAREIEGYAYTNNLDLQPLSLVADVLHSWPEYWDNEKKIWIPVDPTWQKTTGGIEYFSKLDLNHFAFVIHGESSENPPPAGFYKFANNPQKDVKVYFSEKPDKAIDLINVKYMNFAPILPFVDTEGFLEIENAGNFARYNLQIDVLSRGASIHEFDSSIFFLAPFSIIKIPIKWRLNSVYDLFSPPSFYTQIGGLNSSYTLPAENLRLAQILSLSVVLLIFSLLVFVVYRFARLTKI